MQPVDMREYCLAVHLSHSVWRIELDLKYMMQRLTDKWAGRQAGRQTERQTERQTDRQTDSLCFTFI